MKIKSICVFLLFALVLLFISHLSKDASCLSRYGGQIVAIKVLNGGNTSEERASLESRFVREVVMMSRVKHANLVKVSIIFLFLPSSLDSVLVFRLSSQSAGFNFSRALFCFLSLAGRVVLASNYSHVWLFRFCC